MEAKIKYRIKHSRLRDRHLWKTDSIRIKLKQRWMIVLVEEEMYSFTLQKIIDK